MASALVQAHIRAQARLRAAVRRAVGGAWDGLGGYDRSDLDRWLALVVPVVAAGQQHAAALAETYVAQALRRAPAGVDLSAVSGAAVRAGVSPADVYARPLVSVWGALAAGSDWTDAVAKGRARAVSSAEMDVQLAHRATLSELQRSDGAIRGYRRVADAGACEFCLLVDGAFVTDAAAAPLHNGCGCGFEPVLDAVRPSVAPDGVAIHDHGELGPVLADPAHSFTGPADVA
jgi:hypothetical protein